MIMMGSLHIEMAIWRTIGDYLEASGWTAALTQVSVASFGTADSYLKAFHLSQTIKSVHWLWQSSKKTPSWSLKVSIMRKLNRQGGRA